MINISKICIVGLGLMGGSLALALRKHPVQVVAVERDEATCAMACREGIVDAATADFAVGVRGADLVVLATPVKTIVALLQKLAQARPDGCMVLDFGSTKVAISAAMAELPPAFQAIGGHPMCGKEMAGLAAADAHLYRQQTFVLCRNGRTTEAVEAAVLGLLHTIGAQPLFLSPDVHDRIVAMVSHVPYLVSAALMHSAAAMEEDNVWPVSASGFRDASRLSGSDPRMMLDILLTNRAAVMAQVAQYQRALAAVSELLQSGDEAGLSAWLAETQRQYVAYRASKAYQA